MALDLEPLKKALAEATEGPWEYRPEEYDDWGFIRGGKAGTFTKPIVAVSRAGDFGADFDEHRQNKTDPYEQNGRLIVALRNAAPALIAEVERLREALVPFAAEESNWRPDVGDTCMVPGTRLTLGHLRRARAALNGEVPNG